MATRPTDFSLPQTVPGVFPVGGRPEGDAGSVSEPRVQDDEPDPEALRFDFAGEWADEAEFLAYWRKQYTADWGADEHNIKEAMEDLRFIYVDQWDEATRAEREEAGRPCLTVNTLPQFIGQVVGDRRINRTQIKVIPDKAGTKDGAKVRSGLIRSIEQYSRAERVYDMCCEDQVGCGISNFEVTLEYATNDAFDQDIFVRPLPNPFAVVWDRLHHDPTGRDAKYCFVEEVLPKETFTREFPDHAIPTASMGEFDFGEDLTSDEVKVVALWRMIEKDALFALMQDGQVEDVSEVPFEAYAARVAVHPVTGQPHVKQGVRTYAQRWLLSSFAILEGPYELPLSRLPIIKVSGRVGRVGLKKYRFGLVRWARDPSLLRNYWRSIAAETLAMAPKAQFMADAASVKGREEAFREAHLTGDPLLVYNTGKNKPERVEQPQLPTAILQEANMNAQDIKDVTGLHDASLGIRSNEVSGKAIMARQREGDVASITYHDHLNMAIEEGGVVINELIPVAYDTVRTIRTVGVDDTPEFFKVNDPQDEASPDLTFGKYDVKVITGPSYTTQRVEAAELMMEMTKTMPELMSQAADITMESLDVPGAEKLAARFRKLIPVAQQEEQEREAQEREASGQPPEEAQVDPAQAAAAEMAAMQLEFAKAEMEAKLAEMQAKVAEAQAKAKEAEAKAQIADLEIEKTEEEIRLLRSRAEAQEAQAIDAHLEIGRKDRKTDAEIEQKRRPQERPARSQPGGGSRSAGGSRSGKDTRK